MCSVLVDDALNHAQGMDIESVLQRIGRRVQALRRARGLSQEALAEAIDRSVDTISLVERGRAATRIETAVKLAEALGVDLVALFGDPLPPQREHPLIEELIELLAGRDPALLQIAVDQVRLLLKAADQTPVSIRRPASG